MIDLTAIKKYITDLDRFAIQFIKNEIKTVGLIQFLEYNFNSLDCTKLLKSGFRAMQTIGYPYMYKLTETVYTIDNYIEDNDKDDWYIRLLKLHEANIEYEKLNPPIWYGGDKYKNKFEKYTKTNKSKNNKQNKNINSNTKKKITAAEKKLAVKAAKLNNLTFKIKSIK